MFLLLAAGGMFKGQSLGKKCSVLHEDEHWELTVLYFFFSLCVILLLSVDRMPDLNALFKLNPLQISCGQRMAELLTIH
jgi:hypothetical protein